MKHLKGNSYDVVKLVIDQLGISIFALVLYISMNIVGENNEQLGFVLNILASVFSILFYWALLYSIMWEMGAKDCIRIESGKTEKFAPKGALLALFANLVNLLLAGLAVVFEIVRLCFGTDALNGITTIFFVIIRFTSAMFLRSVNAICLPFGGDGVYIAEGAVYMLFFIMTIGVCQLAYSLGMNNFKIFGSKAKKQ